MANRIEIIDGDNVSFVDSIPGVKITFCGDDAVVRFKKPLPKILRCNFDLGNHSVISFDSNKRYITDLYIDAKAPHSTINIGKDFSCYRTKIAASNEKYLSVNIGDYCIFASGITLRVTDAHAIIDKNTGKVLNHGKDINIGNHVWVAADSTILKGVSLPDWTVVGAGSIVTKSFTETNCAIAGNPAKLLRHDIYWDYRDAYAMEHPRKMDDRLCSIFEINVPNNYKVNNVLFDDGVLIKENANIWNSYSLPVANLLKPNTKYLIQINNSKLIKGECIFYQLSFKDDDANSSQLLKNIIINTSFCMAFEIKDKVPNIDVKLYSGEAGNSDNKSIEIDNIKLSEIEEVNC